MNGHIDIPYVALQAMRALRLRLPPFHGYEFFFATDKCAGESRFLVSKTTDTTTRTLTFAVRGSRYYELSSSSARKRTKATYHSWFALFGIDPRIDFYLFSCTLPDHGPQPSHCPPPWKTVVLCFTPAAMRNLLAESRGAGGRPARALAFAYGEHESVIQIRGDPKRRHRDFSSHRLLYWYDEIEKRLTANREMHPREAAPHVHGKAANTQSAPVHPRGAGSQRVNNLHRRAEETEQWTV